MAQSAVAVAVEAAREAGGILLERLGRVREIRYKGTIDLVTEADRLSEEHVIGRLRGAFPEHAVLAEESGALGEARRGARWLVDPLDGTTNFAHGYPVFAVSIALEVDGAVELGVVYAPVPDELFVAERGRGATLNGGPIRVSETDEMVRSLLATGFLYDPTVRARNLGPWADFVMAAQGVRRSGAAALDLCNVAAGRLDGYWEEGLSPWDSAAGALLVVEAGGRVTDYRGGAYVPEGRTVLASNGRIHDHMMAILAGALGREGAT